jgi:MFS family permease
MPEAKSSIAQGNAHSRPLSEIARQPVFLVAVLSSATAYGSMNLVMVATPLAMTSCLHSFDDAASVIQWHVLGMFAPSFITGRLIARFGVLNIMLAGTLMILGCVAVAMGGIALADFWLALVLLGCGWNFLYLGATTLLTYAYADSEKAKVQGTSELATFALVTLASLSSGALHHHFGWGTVNLSVVPLVLLSALAVLSLRPRLRVLHPGA